MRYIWSIKKQFSWQISVQINSVCKQPGQTQDHLCMCTCTDLSTQISVRGLSSTALTQVKNKYGGSKHRIKNSRRKIFNQWPMQCAIISSFHGPQATEYTCFKILCKLCLESIHLTRNSPIKPSALPCKLNIVTLSYVQKQ